MMKPRLAILAAVASNRTIGLNNTLPWHLPADLKHFKALTLGQIIVMGRRTYESIGRPLPGRTNIVLTRQQDLNLPDVSLAQSIEEAVNRYADSDKAIFIIGGATLYQQALPLCQRLYLTEIQQDFPGDTFFPEFNRNDWQEISREIHHASDSSEMEFHFVVLDRRIASFRP
jgi:dihydrofolate reductase